MKAELVRLDWDAHFECDLPSGVDTFLRAGQRLIDQVGNDYPDFIESDYVQVYQLLRGLQLPARTRFVEWGSGFGVVTGLAALLGWEATGIEVDPEMATYARDLLQEYDVPAHIVCDDVYTSPSNADADLIFSYPWPNLVEPTKEYFRLHAGANARLFLYEGPEDLSLWGFQ